MQIQVTLIQKWTLEKIEWTRKWKVASPYVWEIRNWQVYDIVVPNGFITDFGSIPRLLWILFNPTWYHSYILHDYLYEEWIINRKLSDLSLQIWLLSEGASQYEAYLVYPAVRVFWFRNYKNKNK